MYRKKHGMDKEKNNVVQIDIEQIIKAKSKKLHSLLPRFVINYIRKIIHEDEINDIFKRYHLQDGISFANGIIEEFNVKINIFNEEKIPTNRRFIIACNHPLGGFDGLALISLISRYRKDIKFPVNDFLMHIPNLQDIFIPINKTGYNSIELARRFDEIFNSDNVILYFPAGICSRRTNGVIQDMEWKKTFVTKAKKFHRDILPIYFNGRNSNFFYNLANIRKKTGIKANIEMAFLPNELFNQRNSSYNVYIGDLIHHESLTSDKSDYEWAQEIKRQVYSLV